MAAFVGTSIGDDETDLIGLISSFLGPSISDSGGTPPSMPSGCDAPSPSCSADIITTEDNNACFKRECVIPPARVVIFSKDRPWQLKQLLRSMKLCTEGTHYKYLSASVDIRVILRASTPKYARGYQQVMHGYDGVNFLIEDDAAEAKSFSCLLETALKEDTHEDSDEGIVLFLTDDCLLLEPLDVILYSAAGALQYEQMTSPSTSSNRDHDVFNFTTRLHPGISWCQTRGVPSPPPREEMKYHSLAQCFSKFHEGYFDNATNPINDGVYLYNRKGCSGEFIYPFDLSGGAYRHSDVFALLGHLKKEERNHPNTFELNANQLHKATGENTSCDEHHLDELIKPLSAIPSRPFLVILAVNRVQDVYQAPLALPRERKLDDTCKESSEESGKCIIDPSNPEALLDLLDQDCYLDVAKYKMNVYNSSHIGDWFLKYPSNRSEKQMEEGKHYGAPPAHPQLSVLMPVHSGPPDAASHSIISIVMQPIEEFHLLQKEDGLRLGNECCNNIVLSPMQIVVVDDRCNDGSIDAMIRSFYGLAQSHEDISFTVQDHRFEIGPQNNDLSTGDECVSISLDIVKSPRAGVACALNHGLGYCRADLVARMDADDIVAPQRLLSQIGFMHVNPSFDVVGTSTVLFSARSKGGKQYNQSSILPYHNITQNTESCYVLRSSLSISDPGFMAWAMLFTCTVSHPSVIFRKKAIQELGGYDESISRCEDYDLWMRLLDQNCRSIVCLPLLGLWHRKHGLSSSKNVGSITQKVEAEKVCYAAIERMFHSTNNDVSTLDFDQASLSTLRDPSSAQTPESLDIAANLLQQLEISFLQQTSGRLTQQETALIKLDCNERIGELATISITKFGNITKIQPDGKSSSFAWKLWCERCPEKQLERLSLLCHTNMKNTSGSKK